MISFLFPEWAQSAFFDVTVVSLCVVLFVVASGRARYVRFPVRAVAVFAFLWVAARFGAVFAVGWLGMPRRIVHPIKSPAGAYAVTVRELEGDGLAGSVVAEWSRDAPDVRLFRGEAGGVTSADVSWASEHEVEIHYRGRMAADPGCHSTAEIKVRCIHVDR